MKAPHIRSVRVLVAAAAIVLIAGSASAQDESRFASDLRREGEHVRENCSSFSTLLSCAYTLATDYPFHVAMGSLAPENGFAVGLAFVERWTPNETWRINWSADAVRSFGGSWRAGAYMRMIHIPDDDIGVVRPGSGSSPGAGAAPPVRRYPVFHVHAQTISLRELYYFGPGPDSPDEGRSLFTERQTIIGGGVILPINRGPDWFRTLRPSVALGLNGRFVKTGSRRKGDIEPLDQVHLGLTVPGFRDDRGYAQFEQRLRLEPSTPNGILHFDYDIGFQQYVSSGEPSASFRRWTLDLRHEIPIYRSSPRPATAPANINGPNECFSSVGSDTCPPLPPLRSRDRYGAVNLRVLLSSASAFGDSYIPFYFQPTLGGADINGDLLLASLDDYRYRAPHLFALQQSIEHSLWGPIGVFAMAEQGRVADRFGDLGFGGMKTSFTIGATIRAGGMPMIHLAYAWGSGATHAFATIDTSLLGGSRRPSLF
ncbi:MAG TPA: hypothetical protein VIL35_14855 [Vicinamibacterales bacterium]